MIHTIGDSHCGGVTGKPKEEQAFAQISNVIPHWLGPKLMFSIGRDGLDISKFSINDNDTVIFCFGEIDCRCHVHKYKENFTEVINSIVDKFFITINRIHQQRPQIKICIYNVLPPVKKGTVPENPDYPYLGTDEERKTYTQYMNLKIKESCARHNFIFFDVYNDYCCENGFLKTELSDNNVHISDVTYVRNFIKENL